MNYRNIAVFIVPFKEGLFLVRPDSAPPADIMTKWKRWIKIDSVSICSTDSDSSQSYIEIDPSSIFRINEMPRTTFNPRSLIEAGTGTMRSQRTGI